MDVHRVIHVQAICSAFFFLVCQSLAQGPVRENLQGGPASEALRGILPMRPAVSPARARKQCVELPVLPPDDRLLGPHGGSLISAHCDVIAYQALESARPEEWITARYKKTSIFTAEDATRGAAARDTATEEEVVLFQVADHTNLRPVWHARFDTGDYAIWRSITP